MTKTKTQNGPCAGKLSHETRDCTVHALANVAGMSYMEAHSILAAQGREERKGHTPRIAEMRKSLEGRFLIHEVQGLGYGCPGYGMTLAQFARRNWTGSFYVTVTKGDASRGTRGSHQLAVVNGVVLDNLPKSWVRAQVRIAWEFEPLRGQKAA